MINFGFLVPGCAKSAHRSNSALTEPGFLIPREVFFRAFPPGQTAAVWQLFRARLWAVQGEGGGAFPDSAAGPESRLQAGAAVWPPGTAQAESSSLDSPRAQPQLPAGQHSPQPPRGDSKGSVPGLGCTSNQSQACWKWGKALSVAGETEWLIPLLAPSYSGQNSVCHNPGQRSESQNQTLLFM